MLDRLRYWKQNKSLPDFSPLRFVVSNQGMSPRRFLFCKPGSFNQLSFLEDAKTVRLSSSPNLFHTVGKNQVIKMGKVLIMINRNSDF